MLLPQLLICQSLTTQSLVWSSPAPVLNNQEVTFSAEVIGNGSLAPSGTATFKDAGTTTLGTANVTPVTQTNYIFDSSQFNANPWILENNYGVLTPDYTTDPLGGQTAYRYQNTDNSGDGGTTAISQSVSGLPGTQPATFSVWIESNTPNMQNVQIAITDVENGGATYYQPCRVTSSWQRCSVTTPNNTNSVEVAIGNSPWPWDVSIWGAQVESSTYAGVYVSTAAAQATATLGQATLMVGFQNWNATGIIGNSDPITVAYTGNSNYKPSTSPTYIQSTQYLRVFGYCTAVTPELCGTYILEDAAVGYAYSGQLVVAGGTPPYTWSLYEGQLPNGLSLTPGGAITGTPTQSFFTPNFDALVTDSSTPPHTVLQSYQMQLSGGAGCPQKITQGADVCYSPEIISVYPNQPSAGMNGQTVNLYGCLPSNGSGFGTLTLNTPSGVTQVGGLSVTSIGNQGGVMIQGAVNIAYNAQLGTPTSPPLIGLNQQLNGCNENSGYVPYYIVPFCPASITIASTTEEKFTDNNYYFFNNHHLTGIGIFTQMQLNPANGYWTNAATPIFEWLSQTSNTCSSGYNFCIGQASAFDIDVAFKLWTGPPEVQGMPNIFNDQHVTVDWPSPKNLLAALGKNSCQASCRQDYMCGGENVTSYNIGYSLNLGTVQGTSVTVVTATKTPLGNDSNSEVGTKKH